MKYQHTYLSNMMWKAKLITEFIQILNGWVFLLSKCILKTTFLPAQNCRPSSSTALGFTTIFRTHWRCWIRRLGSSWFAIRCTDLFPASFWICKMNLFGQIVINHLQPLTVQRISLRNLSFELEFPNTVPSCEIYLNTQIFTEIPFRLTNIASCFYF